MAPETGRLTRRGLLLAGLGGLLASCASQADGADPGGSAPPSSSGGSASPSSSSPTADDAPEPTETAPAVPAPLDVPPYTVLAGEVEPECKQAAVAAIAAALTWRDGASGPAAAVSRVGALGSPPEAVATLPALMGTAPWSSVEVTYPQYGGLVADPGSASVMVNAQQVLPGDGEVVRRPVTLDVRLSRRASGWRADEMLLAPAPLPAPRVSAAVSAVLAHDRVVLPEAARADLLAGLVDDVVASLLVQLAETWRLHVQVLSTGHPFTVFATDRQSNHTRGRAVDVWALDDIPVIDQARSPWRAFMEAAAAAGADEIGGPRDVDGVRGRKPYFSDDVHQDHVHVGFEVR